MSMSIAEKIKIIRESERLNRRQLAEMVNIPYSSLTYYETGRTTPDTYVTMKILSHPKFLKYTMWFMTNEIAPESGQIAPALAHSGQEETKLVQSEKKTG
ncbi:MULTISPECIES: helix-turn-helix transcriptional regulator [unclassified Arsenophonus]|uniref:helix-turn-helix transcriptional regulator n=1 Tax=unclassified Arsenophonus TaxID=2627083 RepID=UPI0028581DCD|nr:helix-turn-helix transcriptional regulator [Arsenophonus sp.]MDR5611224.1 helix-turn-helix transcriptional regulator [Arsenophonus sp.]MDR5615244.1 helix-turn-helix transcriptional regulator [Arsenophonus sp.]